MPLAQLAQQTQAIPPRQHDVEHDGIEGCQAGGRPAVVSAMAYVNGEALRLEGFANKRGGLLLVFDHQDAHGGQYSVFGVQYPVFSYFFSPFSSSSFSVLQAVRPIANRLKVSMEHTMSLFFMILIHFGCFTGKAPASISAPGNCDRPMTAM